MNRSKRIKFFLTHLAISLVVALIAIAVVFFVWYPMPLAKSVGVTHIFLMLLSIDVIVGPLFTLLVTKEGKRSLKFDLAVIALIQVAAFAYGIFTISQGRPAWIALNGDRFELVRINDIYDGKINQTRTEYQHPSWLGPKFVAALPSKDMAERNQDLLAEVFGVSIAQRPERYVSLEQAKTQLQFNAKQFPALAKFNDQQKVVDIVQQYPDATGWLPMKGTNVDMVVLVNIQKAQVVKIVDLRPW